MKPLCIVRNHTMTHYKNKEICVTCLENEIVKLKAYVERSIVLLKGNDDPEVLSFIENARNTLHKKENKVETRSTKNETRRTKTDP